MESNSSFSYILEIILQNSSLFWIDNMNIFVTIPIAIFGTVLNAISLRVISKEKNNSSLFKYLQVHNLISLIFTMSYFLCFFISPTYFIYLIYHARLLKCNIYAFLLNFFYLYTLNLDFLINLDVLANYNKKFSKFKKISPNLLVSIFFLISFLNTSPYLFQFYINSDQEILLFKRLCKDNPFFVTFYGKSIIILINFLQGPFMIFLTLAFNILSLVSFKNYLKRKKSLLYNNQTNDRMTSMQRVQIKNILKKKRKQTKMTFFISLTAIIINFLQLWAKICIYWRIFGDNFNLSIQSIALLLAAIKYSSNIIFYYNFNSNFKKNLILLFKK